MFLDEIPLHMRSENRGKRPDGTEWDNTGRESRFLANLGKLQLRRSANLGQYGTKRDSSGKILSRGDIELPSASPTLSDGRTRFLCSRGISPASGNRPASTGQSSLKRRRPYKSSFPRRRESKPPSTLAPGTEGGTATPISTAIQTNSVC